MMIPIDTVSRGRLRRWKCELEKKSARLDRFISESTRAAGDFGRCGAVGRERAFRKIDRGLTAAGAGLNKAWLGKDPFAIWSTLRPRIPVLAETEDPGEQQPCVAVEYIALSRAGIGQGLWTIELPDHALGRFLQRAPDANLDAAIEMAHVSLLTSELVPGTVHVPAGPGAFLGSILAGQDKSLDMAVAGWFRARTWLHRDQLDDSAHFLKPVGKLSPFAAIPLASLAASIRQKAA
jgi:hypothetical protein